MTNEELFCKRLRKVLKENGYTFKAAEEVAHLPQGILSKWSKGYFPTLFSIMTLSDATGIDIREFFRPEEEPEKSEVLKKYYGMSYTMQKAIMDIMKVSQI